MNHLQERRMALGLSQRQVSAEIRKVDPRYDVGMISRIENGVCYPTQRVMRALETVLQATQSELYAEDELSGFEAIAATEPLPEPTENITRVVKHLRYGPGNSLSRHELCALTGYDDRIVRNKISKAVRLYKYPIINDRTGNGYHLADEDEIDAIEREYWQLKGGGIASIQRSQAFKPILIRAGKKV